MRTLGGILCVTGAVLLTLLVAPLAWHIAIPSPPATDQNSYFVVMEIGGLSLGGWRLYAVTTGCILLAAGLATVGLRLLRPAIRGD